MPRFNEQERETISHTLMSEGEKLFSNYGLRKVTVDDLAEVANISKGSFYAFFQSKEHLFIEINFKLQSKLFDEVENELRKKENLPKDELLVLGIKLLLHGFLHHPILTNLESNTWEYLRRKLPTEVFEKHTLDDSKIIDKFIELGIEFKEPYNVLIRLLRVIFSCLAELKDDPEQERILDIVIYGIVQQIVV
ncbi:helix-turn-helix domain-containing protein [Blautia pseudococcoides]|nr:helix-turn-helix domain-containing protein [Blautia pseudococcoides]QJU13531.1 helix-turn-helix transcriptional regulator [Blautia pseudococcoides]QQQ93864.1 helix-turn-helix transcriptional regulator [Blautia pseudococcoides]